MKHTPEITKALRSISNGAHGFAGDPTRATTGPGTTSHIAGTFKARPTRRGAPPH